MTRRVTDAAPGWVRVYSLADDNESVSAMQQASRSRDRTIGLARRPLVGSAKWWSEIHSGKRPLVQLEGLIDRVFWGGMGDMPEFEFAVDGEVRSKLCEGDCRRYVAGCCVRYAYVQHPWKKPNPHFGTSSEVVIEVWLEDTDLRSSGIAPGPGGAGYRLARGQGDVVHYLTFSEQGAAQQAAETLRSGPWSDISRCIQWGQLWHVEVWERRVDNLPPRIRELREFVEPLNGAYDGGEEVAGTVWGPHGNHGGTSARDLGQ